MRARRAIATGVTAVGLAGLLAACGGSSSRGPDVSRVPLVSGARTVAKVTQCDPGAAAYCGVDLVLYDSRYHTSEDLLHAEREALHAGGWTDANAEVGPETAADSPGHKIHVTYAPASGELDAIDQRWVKRPRPITLALSNSMFQSTPALAMVVEIDSGAT